MIIQHSVGGKKKIYYFSELKYVMSASKNIVMKQ